MGYEEPTYHWWVKFNSFRPPYAYISRSTAYMVEVVKKHRDRHGENPLKMWVMDADGHVEEVVIT